MIQELRKSLIFHTICCNSSLLQLQIIPPSTAESDNSDKQPIASCLGLPPDTLKLLLPFFTTEKTWQIEHNIFKTYPSASINSLSNRLEGAEYSLVFKYFHGNTATNCLPMEGQRSGSSERVIFAGKGGRRERVTTQASSHMLRWRGWQESAAERSLSAAEKQDRKCF